MAPSVVDIYLVMSFITWAQTTVWRMLRNQVQIAIDKAKIFYHANRVRNLQKSQSRKWYQEFRKITNTGKTELKINIPGIDDIDGIGKANYINNIFTDVSAHVPPLDFDELPAFLPAKRLTPHLYPWEVYNELRKINPDKSRGPDRVSTRLIKEFAYEISVPFTDILNCSFKEEIVPHQWKKAIVVPIPKQMPARIDKLRPVSLTYIFAKIAEGFVSSWVLNDISDIIDKKQFGNVPCKPHSVN